MTALAGAAEHLPHRYAIAFDEARLDELGSLFCEDARFDMTGLSSGPVTLKGRSAIVQALAASRNDPAAPKRRHVVTNVCVAKRTSSRIQMESYLTLVAVEAGSWRIRNMGRYLDEIVAVSDQWQFKTRQLFVDELGQ